MGTGSTAIASGPRPGSWTFGRVLVLAFLLFHVACVLAFTLPESSLRDRFFEWKPALPVINTHKGEALFALQPAAPVVAYLAATGQGQRWQMFTPRRRFAEQLEFQFRFADGTTRTTTLRELESFPPTRWIKWRLMEWVLLGTSSRQTYLPAAARALARHYFPGAVGVVVHKRSYPVPVLEEDGSGAPVFQSAAWFEAYLADPGNLKTELLGRYPLKPDAEPR